MKRRWLSIVCLSILLGVSSGAWGEYYQYEDSEGVVHFTDDPSLIPSEQRDEAKVNETISDPPMSSESISDSEEDALDTSKGESDVQSSLPGSADGAGSEELDARREELLKMYREIEAEKKALGDPPPKSAKSGVKADYEQRSRGLNQKIREYNKLSLEFEKKVKEFNSRIMQK